MSLDPVMLAKDSSTCQTGSTNWTTLPDTPLEKSIDGRKQSARHLAYIDGLRGFAALLVYVLHYQGFGRSLTETAYMENAWGYNGRHYFATLPFVRTMFIGGHHGVTTFLVISGYVLSHSPMRHIHAKDTVGLHNTVSSALLRRFLRLWIPVAVTTFIFMLCWYVFDIRTLHEKQGSLSSELIKWYDVTRSTSFLYVSKYYNDYNFHVWTIPLEFRGSMTVYTVLIALQNVPKTKRLLCQILLIWYFTYICDGWYCALFISGMLLCDLDLLADSRELPSVFQYFHRVKRWIFVIMIVVALYLGGVPCAGDSHTGYLRGNPGWYWLSYTVPRAMSDYRWWFRGWAAILTVAAVPRVEILRSFFESAPCQYLGKISYSFYLVHGPILFTVGDRVYAATGRIADHHADLVPQWINWLPLPSWGPLGMEVNIIAPHLILLPLTIWIADLATRLIDEPTVKFCRWFQRWLTEEERLPPREKLEQYV